MRARRLIRAAVLPPRLASPRSSKSTSVTLVLLAYGCGEPVWASLGDWLIAGDTQCLRSWATIVATSCGAGFMPKVVATSNGAYSDQTWLTAQKPTAGAAGWLGRDPTAIDLASKKPSWTKVNEIYKKYSHGQDMGELAMREITGLLWMADTINRAKSVEPAALAKVAAETDMKPDQMIIDYKGIKFGKDHQNELAAGVVTQIGWDDEKHTIWPWDLAAQAGFKTIYPAPNWPERESRSKK